MLLHYWQFIGKFVLNYRDLIHFWLIFMTLSGPVTLSGVVTFCVVTDDISVKCRVMDAQNE